MDFLRRYIYLDLLNYLEIHEVHHPRMFYVSLDPFQRLSRQKFIQVYRLTKERVHQIIDIVRQYQPIPARRSALAVSRKVLTALRFFAGGSYQLDVGLGVFSAISQPSVSRCIHVVLDVFNRVELLQEYIEFYRNIEELRESRHRFFERYRVPHVIGCIECTHIAIVPPLENDPEYPENVYVNRKGYHSLNVQLICDSDLKIRHVDAQFPGSTHDAFIWNNCNVEPLMRQIYNINNERFYLLGDSGYPLRPWMMTPFRRPQPQTPEGAFNRVFCRARSVIERVNGILKMRFRCSLKDRVLHYTPTTASYIVNTCCVLHNMAITDGLDILEKLNTFGKIMTSPALSIQKN